MERLPKKGFTFLCKKAKRKTTKGQKGSKRKKKIERAWKRVKIWVERRVFSREEPDCQPRGLLGKGRGGRGAELAAQRKTLNNCNTE